MRYFFAVKRTNLHNMKSSKNLTESANLPKPLKALVDLESAGLYRLDTGRIFYRNIGGIDMLKERHIMLVVSSTMA